MTAPAAEPLLRREKIGLVLLALLLIAFGVVHEIRGAFLSRRMGDGGCYLRGAWAARTGAGLYDVTDNNDWHYNYPPLYAILLMPLADPPADQDDGSFVPFGVSIGAIYALNLLCLVIAAHLLAAALERGNPPPRFSRRWWALRVWPATVCLVPIGHTLMRSQVNVQVLALLAAALALGLDGKRFRAGLFLAAAICIKVIPAYLLVYPLWKRDGRTLAGCAAGLFVGLVAIPVAAFGPERAAAEYERYASVLFGPLLNLSDDNSRQDELLGVNATDSVGVKNALHNWMYPDRVNRPEEPHVAAVWAYRLLGLGMTFVTLWPIRRSMQGGGWAAVQQLGALVILMAIFSPICHMHYFAFCLPLVAAMMARSFETQGSLRMSNGTLCLFGWFNLMNLLPSIPGLELTLRDCCLTLFGALPLWAAGVVQLWQYRPACEVTEAAQPRAAA